MGRGEEGQHGQKRAHLASGHPEFPDCDVILPEEVAVGGEARVVEGETEVGNLVGAARKTHPQDSAINVHKCHEDQGVAKSSEDHTIPKEAKPLARPPARILIAFDSIVLGEVGLNVAGAREPLRHQCEGRGEGEGRVRPKRRGSEIQRVSPQQGRHA